MKKRNLLIAACAALLTVVVTPLIAFGDTTTTIQDTQQGTGVGQVQFSANWNLCTTTCAKAPDNSYRWTSTVGSTATVRFTGYRITLFGVKEPWSNIATVSIDGGPTVDVDFYANPATSTVVQVYQSPVLTEGTHTLVMTMTSRRNPSSGGGSAITFDRAEIISTGGTPSPTPPASCNLASQGRPATASSVQSNTTHVAANAVDGNLSTRWSSNFSDPQWIRIDLGSTQSVCRVVLRWETAYGRAYQIQTSNDATNWTNIFSTTTGDGGVDDLTITGSGRYVRMYGTVRGTQYGYSLWEFQVYTGQATSPSPTSSPPSGFWLSGGSRDTNTQAAAVEWGNMRGRTVNLVTVYTNRTSDWNGFVSSHATVGQPAAYNNSYTLIIQTPPFPENTGSTYSALVAGSYDTYWRQIGTLMQNKVNQGFPPPIVSIGWEFNGNYMYWGGCAGDSRHYSSPAQYVAGYRRIVQQLRVTYPSVQTAWTINAHSTPSCTGSSDVSAFYPGDDVVTYVGTDDYDHYPPAPTKADFDARANANAGLYYMGNLARSHGKQMLVPEWGVAPGSGSNGTGDNANYIQWMFETYTAWFNENPKLLKGEFYFADPCGGGNVDSDLIACNPNSRARYQFLW